MKYVFWYGSVDIRNETHEKNTKQYATMIYNDKCVYQERILKKFYAGNYLKKKMVIKKHNLPISNKNLGIYNFFVIHEL